MAGSVRMKSPIAPPRMTKILPRKSLTKTTGDSPRMHTNGHQSGGIRAHSKGFAQFGNACRTREALGVRAYSAAFPVQPTRHLILLKSKPLYVGCYHASILPNQV